MAGTFLVVQGLRICLLVRGTQIWSPVRDATCLRATKPLCHNYWACALEPSSHNYWALHATNTETWASGACAPQQEKSPQGEATAKSSPIHRNERKFIHSNEDPAQPKIKKKFVTCLAFTHLTIFLVCSLSFGVLRILVSEIIFKYNDKCESWIITLNKWGHGGEISRSELWLKAILETY